ncbi:MAG: sugar transferase, partial [Fulvivirga sp.]|nr:sugar transferase [Fulvivirga sp.]
MKEQLTIDKSQALEKSKEVQVFGKRILCITKTKDLAGLKDRFDEIQTVESVKALTNLIDVPCHNQPDAVVYYIERVNEKLFGNLRYAKEILKRCTVPLLVVGEEISKQEKQAILKNGADDYFSKPLNAESINYWVDFLKMFKKLSKEESTLQIKPFNFKISLAKRAFDIAVASTVLLMLSPLLLLIALIIKLESKGPVFYISKRAGSGYKVINFIKFRSMSQGAEKELNKLLHLNQYGGGNTEVKDKSGNPVFFKVKDDPRVTRFGKFLRNTSLDELPQLINVLKGDMSIVGNRPLPLYEAQQLTKDQCAMRFMAAAGITGLWQVTKRGRAEMSEDERIELDMTYAQENSFIYDMQLVFKTIPALFQ